MSKIPKSGMVRQGLLPMRVLRLLGIWFVAGVLITDGRAASPSDKINRIVDFQGDGVTITSNFEGGRLNEVSSNGKGSFTAVVAPEVRPMSNDQSWYAFKISSQSPGRVTVALTYTDGKSHLFAPRISRDRRTWELLPETSISKASDGRGVVLRLDVGPEPLWVSAQELFTESDFNEWIDGLAKKPFITTAQIGESTKGRPIRKMEITEAPADAPLVVVLGRQHPPEVTGTLGLKSFVETIAGDSALAQSFRKQYRVLVMPLANPDGVNAGHWRFNVNGVDINRDWGSFEQKEDVVLRDEILRARSAAKDQMPFFIDYHSTRKDVFYPRPEVKSKKPDSDLEEPDRFMRKWLARVKELTPGKTVPLEVSPATRDKKLNATTWMRDLGAASVTHEFAHDTDREVIRKAGEADAVALMELLPQETASRLGD